MTTKPSQIAKDIDSPLNFGHRGYFLFKVENAMLIQHFITVIISTIENQMLN